MKKNIIILVSCILVFSSHILAQDSIVSNQKDSTGDVETVIIRETKWRILRDTIVVKSDSALIDVFQRSIDSLKDNQSNLEDRIIQELNEVKRNANNNTIQYLLLLTLLFIILGLIVSRLYRLSKGKLDDVEQQLGLVGRNLNDILSALDHNHNTPMEPDSPSGSGFKPSVVERPTLEAYNASVYEFVTINDHIHNLRKKETKGMVLAMYRYFALHTTDKAQLLSEIRTANVSDDVKEQFVALVSRINNFFVQKKPIIDGWLYYEPKDGINNYESAIRMPEGLTFDDNLDEDVLGDDITGQQVSMVHKIGYYFPGNTIKPYREKSIVSV